MASGSNVWCGIASIMGSVGANIQDAAGAFLRDTELCDGEPTFSAHPFGTRLTPFLKPGDCEDGVESFAVAILVKASIAEGSVPTMTHLLHTTFPRLVCTVTYGGVDDDIAALGPPSAASSASAREEAAAVAAADAASAAERKEQQPPPQRALTGTIRLFGSDQAGQLARIAEVLSRCGVTILDLLVTTGFGDGDTHEFLERAGGPLSQNVISVAAFDRAAFDEELLRREVTKTAREVGYDVTSIIFGGQAERAREREALADYYLKRKTSIKEYLMLSYTHDL